MIHHIAYVAAEAAFRLEALDCLHETDIAFGDDFANWQAITAIAHCNLRDEAKMAGHQLVCGFRISVLVIALRQHVFFLRLKHWKAANFFQITG